VKPDASRLGLPLELPMLTTARLVKFVVTFEPVTATVPFESSPVRVMLTEREATIRVSVWPVPSKVMVVAGEAGMVSRLASRVTQSPFPMVTTTVPPGAAEQVVHPPPVRLMLVPS
jgi:hypothetical protein